MAKSKKLTFIGLNKEPAIWKKDTFYAIKQGNTAKCYITTEDRKPLEISIDVDVDVEDLLLAIGSPTAKINGITLYETVTEISQDPQTRELVYKDESGTETRVQLTVELIGGDGITIEDSEIGLSQNTKDRIQKGVTAESWKDHSLEGYLKEADLDEYATEEWVEDKGYITSYIDTKYTAGTNMSLSGTVFSATDTKYTEGTNVRISGSNVISAINTDTTYSSGTKALLDIGSDTDDRVWKASSISEWGLNKFALRDITISAGTGLTGGGSLSYNRTISVKYGSSAGTSAQGNDPRIVEAFKKVVESVSITGDSNKTITLTREDGTVLTASFLDNNDPQLPDDVINFLEFNTNDDGVLIAITSEGEIISVSLDGRYSLLGHQHIIADVTNLQEELDGKQENLTSANAGDNITIAGGVISSEAGGATELVEVTQQAYQDKALYVPSFDIGGGMTYQEGSVDFGLSETGHQMGAYSFRVGVNTEASGDVSVAMGNGTEALEEYSVAMGFYTRASGFYSVAMGNDTEASGDASVTMGGRTEALGNYSVAMGYGTKVSEYASLAIGQFSTGGIPEEEWTPGSPIFKVGNGTDASNRKNAYTLYNDGRSEQAGIMEYTSDLTADFTENTLVTKRYVDEATADLNMTVQEIDTGGNYNNLEVTGNVLVFKNENAQAILNGLHGKKVIEIHNLSQTQDLRISNMSSSVSGNGKPIKSPIDIVLTGKGGTARLVYNEVEEYYILVDVWASTTRPEFPDVDEDKAIIVDAESNAKTMDIVEIRVFRDAQTVAMTKQDLNTAYPDAFRGFEVICKEINRSYMKVDNNTNDWVESMNTDVV